MSTDVPAHMPYQNNRSVLIVAFAVLIYTIQQITKLLNFAFKPLKYAIKFLMTNLLNICF